MSEQKQASLTTYEEFTKKLPRYIVLDDVTPHVTVPMVETALGQFGKVISVVIMKDPLTAKNAARRVIVEMGTQAEAIRAVKEIQEHPFMMKGVPRPVRAYAAPEMMFPDRPRKPSNTSKKTFHWVRPGEPDWDKYSELKRAAKRHAAEVDYMLQAITKEEIKLAEEQEKKVKENIKKLDEIQSNTETVVRLRSFYGLKQDNVES